MLDGPLTHNAHGVERKPTPWLYCEAQKRDAWTGDCDNPQYDGTSVRAGAKALAAHGMLKEYRWAQNFEDVLTCLLEVGPLVMGSRWPEGFMRTDENGWVRFSESGNYGHAYKLDGVNLKRDVVRIKNSWGRNSWGRSGFAWVSIPDLRRLFEESWSEACYPVAS